MHVQTPGSSPATTVQVPFPSSPGGVLEVACGLRGGCSHVVPTQRGSRGAHMHSWALHDTCLPQASLYKMPEIGAAPLIGVLSRRVRGLGVFKVPAADGSNPNGAFQSLQLHSSWFVGTAENSMTPSLFASNHPMPRSTLSPPFPNTGWGCVGSLGPVGGRNAVDM